MTGSPSPTNFSLPALTLVLGGARSGKSRLAEGLVTGTGRRPVYLATAEAFDDEMATRIARHRADRAGAGWRTVEAPRDLAAPLQTAADHETVLIDCATLWLTNVMLGGQDLAAETARLTDALSACRAPVVIVSNEVGSGIVPDNRLARDFRDAQGRLNQRLAAVADLAVLVVAGLPVVLKGRLPG